MGRHADRQLMQKPRKYKHRNGSRSVAPTASDHRKVDMPSHKMVYGRVPRPPISTHARAVPPLTIKLSVSKSHDFGQGIEHRLEDCKKASQPDDERNRGQLHQPFDDEGRFPCGAFERVAKDRRRVLSRC